MDKKIKADMEKLLSRIDFNERCRTVYSKAINHWGESGQVTKAIEEMSELQKILCKHLIAKRYGDKKKVNELINQIKHEILDVSIMIDQLRLIFGISDDEYEGGKGELINSLHHRIDHGGFK